MCDKRQPCDLCGTDGIDHDNGTLRGLTLCDGCDRELGGGKFSSRIATDERRAMNRGAMLVDRPPLAK